MSQAPICRHGWRRISNDGLMLDRLVEKKSNPLS
jgi:hypothetical protein